MTLRIVVTGTGRSGTMWAARVMGQAGLTATHETVFDHTGAHLDLGIEAESSCYAAYHLDKIPDVPVALIYRHPADQMRSGLAYYPAGWPQIWEGTGRQPHFEFHPEMESMDTFDAMCFMYVRHHELILRHHPRWVFNLNAVNWYDILYEIGVPPYRIATALWALPSRVNASEGVKPPLPRPVPKDVMDMYEQLEGKAT